MHSKAMKYLWERPGVAKGAQSAPGNSEWDTYDRPIQKRPEIIGALCVAGFRYWNNDSLDRPFFSRISRKRLSPST